jgi:hypothetical protein
MGRIDDARACFEEGLKVSEETVEHGLLEDELEKLPKQARSFSFRHP